MYKLLIVDDEIRIRNGIKTMIENGMAMAFQFLFAKTGREGLEIIRSGDIHLVITDIRMPDMDGLDMIEQICETVANPPVFMIISGYDNFQYARKAMKYGVKEYLLKPVGREELLNSLRRSVNYLEQEKRKNEQEIGQIRERIQSRNILKESYLKGLAENGSSSDAQVEKDLASVGIRFTGNFFKAVLIDFKYNSREYYESFDELDLFAVKNIAEELSGEHLERVWTFYSSRNKLVLLINYDEPDKHADDRIRTLHSMIEDNLRKHLNIEVFTTVSCFVSGIKEIKSAFTDVCRCNKNKIIPRREAILFCNSQKAAHEKDDPVQLLYTPAFKNIAGEAELLNQSNVIQRVDRLFVEMDFGRRDISVIEDFYIKFCSYMYYHFVSKSQEFYAYFKAGDNGFPEFDCFWDLSQLCLYLKRYLMGICDFITVLKNGTPSGSIAERMIDYVNKNYDRDINLNTVADHMGKSNSYLSVLFKKETGKNFINFLADVRIQKARELLSRTDMKISDIASHTGYINEKYFFSVFKKHVGVSPQQYRDSAQ